MTELEGDRPDEVDDAEQEAVVREYTRRESVLLGLKFLVGGSLGLYVAIEATDAIDEKVNENQVTDILQEGIESGWTNLAVHPGIIVMNPGTHFRGNLFKDVDPELGWEEDSFLCALRPIMVRQTLLENLGVVYPEPAASVREKIESLSPNLMAFWLPNSGPEMVFLDPSDEPVGVTSVGIRRSEVMEGERYSDQIVGAYRDVQGGLVYPMLVEPYRRFDPRQEDVEEYKAALAKFEAIADPTEAERAEYSEAYDQYTSWYNYRTATHFRMIGHTFVVTSMADLEGVLEAYKNNDHYEVISPFER